MLLKICHQSTYHYDQPVPFALQRLRMTPRNAPMQSVLDWRVTCQGATTEVSYFDGYDNKVELIRHERNAHEIIVTAEGMVSTTDTAGVFGMDDNQIPTSIFIRETLLTAPGKAVRALAREINGITNELERLHALKQKLNERMRFDTSATNASTTAEEACEAGHGVCQDYAHVFSAAARLTGIPTRYVSGYLMMIDSTEQTASHAWAESFVTGLGWVGFDAANNTCPNEHYVRVATGLDYRDAAPVSGIRLGDGNEKLAVHLKVEQ